MIPFEVFARTEIGCSRERNEDAFLVLDVQSGARGLPPEHRHRQMGPPGTLIAVCDGMGGAASGDLASRIALEGLEEVVQERGWLGDVPTVEQLLLKAVTVANRKITEYTKRHPESRGMGTTMTAAAIFGPDVVIVQVGDSRAYLKRGFLLQQLTMDQNVVGQMIATGRIRPHEAKQVKQRNMLLEAIGVQERVGPDLIRVRVEPGDVLLLCTDGLTGPLEDRHVLELMLRHEDPVRCCRALTEAACAAGGPDNVTVAMVRFLGDGHGQSARPVEFERRSALA